MQFCRVLFEVSATHGKTVPLDFLNFDGKIIAVFVAALPEATGSAIDSIDFTKRLGEVACCCAFDLIDCVQGAIKLIVVVLVGSIMRRVGGRS